MARGTVSQEIRLGAGFKTSHFVKEKLGGATVERHRRTNVDEAPGVRSSMKKMGQRKRVYQFQTFAFNFFLLPPCLISTSSCGRFYTLCGLPDRPDHKYLGSGGACRGGVVYRSRHRAKNDETHKRLATVAQLPSPADRICLG